MQGFLETAGERLEIDCSLSWAGELIAEGAAGELRDIRAAPASVQVRVEADRQPFDTRGWEVLARGAWRRNDEVIVENACTAGFDLHVSFTSGKAEFTYRWNPPAREGDLDAVSSTLVGGDSGAGTAPRIRLHRRRFDSTANRPQRSRALDS